MQEHHLAWLSAHPHRDEGWLHERLRDGFDVHHLDGDHGNNDPANLVLIEHTDHMALHGGRMLGRLAPIRPKRKRKPYRARKNDPEAAWRRYFETQQALWMKTDGP